MNRKREVTVLVVVLLLAVLFLVSPFNRAKADSAVLFEDGCAVCHELGDFEGVSSEDLLAYMLEVKAGEARHPEIELSKEEVARMAEYLAQE